MVELMGLTLALLEGMSRIASLSFFVALLWGALGYAEGSAGSPSRPGARPEPIANTGTGQAAAQNNTALNNALTTAGQKPGDTGATNAVSAAAAQSAKSQAELEKMAKEGEIDPLEAVLLSLNRAAGLANTMKQVRKNRGGKASAAAEEGIPHRNAMTEGRKPYAVTESGNAGYSLRSIESAPIGESRSENLRALNAGNEPSVAAQPDVTINQFISVVGDHDGKTDALDSILGESDSAERKGEEKEITSGRLHSNESAVAVYAAPGQQQEASEVALAETSEEAIDGEGDPEEEGDESSVSLVSGIQLADENVEATSPTQKIIAGARAVFDSLASSQRIVGVVNFIPGFMKLVAKTKAFFTSEDDEVAIAESVPQRGLASVASPLKKAQVNDLDVLLFTAAAWMLALAAFGAFVLVRRRRRNAKA